MALYSWGGGGKDEEWFIVRIILSSEISKPYFLGVEAFFFNLLRVTWREFSLGVREEHVDRRTFHQQLSFTICLIHNKIHLIN